jgi:hypothetical protein
LWFVALFSAPGEVLSKTFHVGVHRLPPRIHMYVDASPWGFGAFLTLEGCPTERISGAWDADDCRRFKLKIGDAAGQAVWEALALLIALRSWSEYWLEEVAVVWVKSDSKAALGALEKERSRSPGINAIARELALDRAVAVFEPLLEFAHVRGTNNEWADALSRLAQPGSGAVVPGPLRSVRASEAPVRGSAWWRTWNGPDECTFA